MRRRGAWVIAVFLGVVVLGGAGVMMGSSTRSKSRVHAGCPPRFSSATARQGLIDGAIAAARAVVIDHRTETNQGRVTRRTRENYWLSEVRHGLGFGSLRAQAVARCGAKVATHSWALFFHDGESPVATYTDIRFAVKTPDGWWIY
jgi:hypothetical protein